MAFHRIKKYFRQIVCQDSVLSCQSNHVEEIPFFKRARVSSLSLRNQKANPGSERSTLLERDLDFLGMVMCWHLLNSKSVPLFSKKNKSDNQRRTLNGKHDRICNSLLTLRGEGLYMALEKYLLFLMPREVKRERTIHFLNQSLPRRDRISLSTLYVNTALGLCQYQIKNVSLQGTWNDKEKTKVEAVSLTLSPRRMFFPCVQNVRQNIDSSLTPSSLQSNRTTQDLLEIESKKEYSCARNRLRGSLGKNLSLYCPSVLNSPDVQDIAQSGLVTLEGSLTLEFI